jgi:hypothetical protein
MRAWQDFNGRRRGKRAYRSHFECRSRPLVPQVSVFRFQPLRPLPYNTVSARQKHERCPPKPSPISPDPFALRHRRGRTLVRCVCPSVPSAGMALPPLVLLLRWSLGQKSAACQAFSHFSRIVERFRLLQNVVLFASPGGHDGSFHLKVKE